MIAAIDWGKLGELLWVAPLAGLAVATVYALVIFGAARAEHARRNRQTLAAAFYGGVLAVSLAGFLAIVVYGVSVITTK